MVVQQVFLLHLHLLKVTVYQVVQVVVVQNALHQEQMEDQEELVIHLQ